MCFDVGCDRHFSLEYQVESGRILVRRTAPVAASGGVECHQVGQAKLGFLRGVADDRKVSSEIEQPKRSLLPSGGAAGFKNLQTDTPPVALLGEVAHRYFQFFLRESCRVEHDGGAVLGSKLEFLIVNIHRNDGGAEGCRDLYAKSPYAADPDEHGDVLRTDAGAANGFPGSSHGVGDDREKFGGDARGEWFRNRTQSARRNADVGCEAAVAIVAGHELVAADGRPVRATSGASSTGDHGRNNDQAALPIVCLIAGSNYCSADLVSQHDGKRLPRGDSFEGKTYIRVADTTAGNLNDDFVRRGLECVQFTQFK